MYKGVESWNPRDSKRLDISCLVCAVSKALRQTALSVCHVSEEKMGMKADGW